MGTEDNGEMGLQQRGCDGMSMPMSSRAAFGPVDPQPLCGSGWDPLVSMEQSLHYPVVIDNQPINRTPHVFHYPSDLTLVDMLPKITAIENEGFSEMISSFGLSDCHPNYIHNNVVDTHSPFSKIQNSQEDCWNLEMAVGVTPNGNRKSSESHSLSNTTKNVEGELLKDTSVDSSECSKQQDEKKQKTEQNNGSSLTTKLAGKQVKDNSSSGKTPKENCVHVRAKRGQATNSHSVAERVRRERIGERMRLLQELVPGCNKITGKAMMLDEIINYVQSLQQQVEFLSMKLATVNPELHLDIEQAISKEVSNVALIGFGPRISSSQPFPGFRRGAFTSIPNTTPPINPLPQNVLGNDLQSIVPVIYDSSSSMSNMDLNGR